MGKNATQSLPYVVATPKEWAKELPPIRPAAIGVNATSAVGPWVSISAGNMMTCAVDKKGGGWCFGLGVDPVTGEVLATPGDVPDKYGMVNGVRVPVSAVPVRVPGDYQWLDVQVRPQ